jgi:hydroxyacylglutathione hydrolase
VHLEFCSAPLLGATCILIVDERGRVVVVDAGGGVGSEVRERVARHGWQPVAVLATHGHVDHTWDAGELCADWGVPMHIHTADAYRLVDPFATLGPLGDQLAAGAGLKEPRSPDPVLTHAFAPLTLEELDLGLTHPLRALHLPGHTEGSTAYLVDHDGTPTMLIGDVLFAGSVGRTDLPGGDYERMAHSLERLADIDEQTVVVPGHGPQTTISVELRTNPYLRAVR